MNKLIGYVFLSICVVVSASSAFAEEAVMNDSAKEVEANKAIAYIVGTEDGSTIKGMVKFYEMAEGVRVMAHITGAPEGAHGIHVHENGSCDDGGKAAGGHYNPSGVDHGFLPKDGHEHAHAGDMGNIVIDENGEGTLEILLPGLSIDAENNVSDRAVILHAKPDDFGQPTGNAGARIGCGEIVAFNNALMNKGSKGSGHEHKADEEHKGSH